MKDNQNTTKKFRISIHPKLAATIDAIVGIVLIWSFNALVSDWWMVVAWFLLRVVWWVVLMRFVYYAPVVRRLHHIRSLGAFQLGMSVVMLFVDQSIHWYVWQAVFILGPALSFWLLPTLNSELSFVGKPHIRWCLMLAVLGIAGIWSGTAAVYVFYSWWSWIIVWVLATAFTVFISMVWWRYYDAPRDRIFLVWSAVMAGVMLQISGILLLWPTGFLITGLLITWLWYMLWQLGRFYFSPDGIMWKKQRRFLLINLAMMLVMILGVAKWK